MQHLPVQVTHRVTGGLGARSIKTRADENPHESRVEPDALAGSEAARIGRLAPAGDSSDPEDEPRRVELSGHVEVETGRTRHLVDLGSRLIGVVANRIVVIQNWLEEELN